MTEVCEDKKKKKTHTHTYTEQSVSKSQCSRFYADTKECVHLGVKGLPLPVCYLPLCLSDRPAHWLTDWMKCTVVGIWQGSPCDLLRLPKGPKLKPSLSILAKHYWSCTQPACRVGPVFREPCTLTEKSKEQVCFVKLYLSKRNTAIPAASVIRARSRLDVPALSSASVKPGGEWFKAKQ